MDTTPGMHIVLVTGGARSGKSRHAQELARELGGDEVTFVATGRAVDDEMARRVQRHRDDRPEPWTTVEQPLGVGSAILGSGNDLVLLDCLTLLISNAMTAAEEPLSEEACLAAADAEVDNLLEAARARTGTLVVVTNEVGMGLVPNSPLGRWFRDAQGRANQRVADAAARVVLLVSGQAVVVKG